MSKRKISIHRATNEPLPSAFILDRYLDSCTDRRAIALHAHQSQTDPVVAITGILIQPNGVPVARDRASGLGNDVFIAIVIEVDKGNAVSLVKFAHSRGCCNVDKFLSLLVVKENIRQNVAIRRSSGTQEKKFVDITASSGMGELH